MTKKANPYHAPKTGNPANPYHHGTEKPAQPAPKETNK